MTSFDFIESLSADKLPAGISVYLQSLWYDAKGDWNRAHQIIQDVDDQDAAWIHAYLHRKEGDISNAGYWYRRAGRKIFAESLKAEWTTLVNKFVK